MKIEHLRILNAVCGSGARLMILSCLCVPCKSIIKMGEGGIPLNFHSNHIELLMPFGILLPAPVVPICLCTKESIHSYDI